MSKKFHSEKGTGGQASSPRANPPPTLSKPEPGKKKK